MENELGNAKYEYVRGEPTPSGTPFVGIVTSNHRELLGMKPVIEVVDLDLVNADVGIVIIAPDIQTNTE